MRCAPGDGIYFSFASIDFTHMGLSAQISYLVHWTKTLHKSKTFPAYCKKKSMPMMTSLVDVISLMGNKLSYTMDQITSTFSFFVICFSL